MPFTTHQLFSADGTTIGYRETGSGPGLIICHGGGRISQNYAKLALALSHAFTVYIPDRRGRGLSGAEGEGYGLQKASEDLAAIIHATRAAFVFGHSAGGLIALETMLTHPVQKLAVYEPPVSVNGSFPLAWLADFERALQKGKRRKAMAISLKGLNVMEGMDRMPLWMLRMLISALSVAEGKKEKGTRMLDLLPTLIADVRMAKEADSTSAKYSRIAIPVALLAGSKSPVYFHRGIQALAETLP